MVSKTSEFWQLIMSNIYRLLELDIDQVQYVDLDMAVKLGLLLFVVVVLKLIIEIFSRRRFSMVNVGEDAYRKFQHGFPRRFKYFIPKLFVIGTCLIFLVALAVPFLTQIKEEDVTVQSRIRIDLRDNSTSMAEFFTNSKETKAQIAAESHLEFVKMRRGQKDFVSLWVFASNPHMIQEFTLDDDELYYFQVYNAPWVSYSSCPILNIPDYRCQKVYGDGGGTDIAPALQALVKYLNQNERARKIKSGSILIITDADVYSFPEKELKELQFRNIKPYLIYIASNGTYDEDGQFVPYQVPEFAKRVSEYGGKYFDIMSVEGLKKAYEEINRLERAEVGIKRFSIRTDLFQVFLSPALVFLFLAIFLGLLIELFGLRSP
ncbi:MAG: hypothetical protein A3B86_02425 [Candidatus Yanofskybacteria bacterium RIFCSPHIGHO2_02_FULL_38_22b]|uniref:Uncharacterized protein n=1 Tax=Candidatus Yanofskybacteria bacterium RIFCSPHIGHO2_02_FULL_38_22b TaxID=1802673 RepID=A0A1F8F4Z3_9BACT|nr:MAG: hypothetical protein A3B86_02425 [Candidatus Yanofskybacteria bacterium RIFCSPHIGHO2_02_FULL_38_22b]OGN20302.1 MAG: hypothetical protein A2910_03260 [Candidatus Yanofskybacteria bacterium RIFCSPLOWO2_01_FULL_39_28]